MEIHGGNKTTCELIDFENNAEFKNCIASNSSDLIFVAEKYQKYEGEFFKADVGDFAKWLKKNSPKIKVFVPKAVGKIILRDMDVWLPLVYLASDITLPIYLSMVANYLSDRMKGVLKGEKARVHLNVVYEDNNSGISKKFNFEGDTEALQNTIKKFDINDFMKK